MTRTLGAKNRSPRELATAGKWLLKESKLKDRIEALKKMAMTKKK